jgi:hypothetical protein
VVVDSQESKRWLKFGSGVYVLHDICELASSRDGFVFEFVSIRSDKNKVAYSLAKWVEKYCAESFLLPPDFHGSILFYISEYNIGLVL